MSKPSSGKYYTASRISVKQGIVVRHLPEGDVSVLKMHIDGEEYEHPWDYDMRMYPFLVEPLLDDIGFDDPILKAAARKYCLEQIQTIGCDGIKMETIMDIVYAFKAGWKCRSPKGVLPE